MPWQRPPWFNSRIKSQVESKNKPPKNYRRFNTNAQLLSQLILLEEQLHFLMNKSKQLLSTNGKKTDWCPKKLQDLLAPIEPFFKQQNNTSNSTFAYCLSSAVFSQDDITK